MFRLARFHFLVFGFLLFLFGYLVALFDGVQPEFSRFIFGYLVFGLAHLSVSFSNDYFDRFSDKTSDKTFFSGGSKVLVENPHLACLALRIAVLLLFFSAIGVVIFAVVYGYSYWFLIFGLLGGLTGWFYTAPPLKFSYRGLGELVTMLAVGFLMPGMGYLVASGTLSASFLILVLPVSCYGLFFIITVELPDLESDKVANKTNLVVKWGRKKGKGISVITTSIGTGLLLVITLLGLIERINLTPIIPFSAAPLIAASVNYMLDSEDKKNLVRQVTANMVSMVLLIVGMNLVLLNQL
jgi:1,4-dihydroxy-2-naphthoate polyprenyltransferase